MLSGRKSGKMKKAENFSQKGIDEMSFLCENRYSAEKCRFAGLLIC